MRRGAQRAAPRHARPLQHLLHVVSSGLTSAAPAAGHRRFAGLLAGGDGHQSGGQKLGDLGSPHHRRAGGEPPPR